MPAKKILLLTRNLVSAPPSEWDALLNERQAVLDQLSDSEPTAETTALLAQAIALETEWQARIARQSRDLRRLLVASHVERQNRAVFHRPIEVASETIEC